MVCFSFTSADARAQTWRITDLGDLGGGSTYPSAMNIHRQVVGSSLTADGLEHAFIWENGVMTDIGILISPYESVANGINDTGHVVGEYCAGLSDCLEGAFFFDGTMHILPELPGGLAAEAFDINNSNQISGWSTFEDVEYWFNAVRWENGIPLNLDDPAGRDADSIGWAINSTGVVAGDRREEQWLSDAPVYWDSAGVHWIPTLGGARGHAWGINDDGWIVGQSESSPSAAGAYLWDKVTTHALPQGDSGAAFAINNSGRSVGTAWFPAFPDRVAALWQNDPAHSFVDLNDYLEPNSGWSLLYWAQDISNDEKIKIVGHGMRTGYPGSARGFLLEECDIPPFDKSHFVTFLPPTGPREYQTIQAAVDAAQPNEFVILAPQAGVHLENVVIASKPKITIQFEGCRDGEIVLGNADVAGSPIFHISDASDVTLRNVGFTDGYSRASGGAVLAEDSTLVIDHCTFTSNGANDHGGAVAVFTSPRVEVLDSVFSGNSASRGDPTHGEGSGGAIHIDSASSARLERNRYTTNSAMRGGAVSIRLSGSPVSEVLLSEEKVGDPAAVETPSSLGNRADEYEGWGGGIYIEDSWVRLDNNCDIGGNQAEFGGGIATRGTVLLPGSEDLWLLLAESIRYDDDPSPQSDGRVIINSSKIHHNQGRVGGGGLAVLDKHPELSFTGNPANTFGGIQTRLIGSEVMENKILSVDQYRGGGVLILGIKSYGSIIDNSHIHHNRSGNDGGGVALVGYAPTIIRNGTRIEMNQAGDGGGGLYATAYVRARIENSFILANHAAHAGSGIHLSCFAGLWSGNTTISANGKQDSSLLPPGTTGGGLDLRRAIFESLGGNRVDDNRSRDQGGGMRFWSGPDCIPSRLRVNLGPGDLIYDNVTTSAIGFGGGISVDGDGDEITFSASGISVINNHAESARVAPLDWNSAGLLASGLHVANVDRDNADNVLINQGSLFHGHDFQDEAAVTFDAIQPKTAFGPASAFLDDANINDNWHGVLITKADVSVAVSQVFDNLGTGIVISNSTAAKSDVDNGTQVSRNDVGVGVSHGWVEIDAVDFDGNKTAAIEIRLHSDAPNGASAATAVRCNIERGVTGGAGVRVVLPQGGNWPGPGSPMGGSIFVYGNDFTGFPYTSVTAPHAYELVMDQFGCPGPGPWSLNARENWWGCASGALRPCMFPPPPAPPACGIVTPSIDTSAFSPTELN